MASVCDESFLPPPVLYTVIRLARVVQVVKDRLRALIIENQNLLKRSRFLRPKSYDYPTHDSRSNSSDRCVICKNLTALYD